jgi:hypothetical protein
MNDADLPGGRFRKTFFYQENVMSEDNKALVPVEEKIVDFYTAKLRPFW